MVRFMGGDESLIPEIKQMAQLQQSLPADDPMHMFGEAVDAAASDIIELPATLDIDQAIAPFMRPPGTIMPLPPDKPGVYFCLVRPSSAKMILDKPIPPGKVLIGYGFSATSVKKRIIVQDKETGHYEYLDCIVTVVAPQLESYLKELLSYQKDSTVTVKGKLVKNGESRVEFFLADHEQYTSILSTLRAEAQDLEAGHAAVAGPELKRMELELSCTQAKAAQAQAEAEKARAEADKIRAEARLKLCTTLMSSVADGKITAEQMERLLAAL